MDGDTALFLSRAAAERLSAGTTIGILGTGIFALVTVLGLWGDQALKKLDAHEHDPKLYSSKEYRVDGMLVVELRPWGRTMSPFMVVVPAQQRNRLVAIRTGSPDRLPEVAIVIDQHEVSSPDGKWAGIRVQGPVTPQTSAYVTFSVDPTEFAFGQFGEAELRYVKPTPLKP